MSNLGLYQWITSTAKKVGGPKNFLFLVGSVGAAAYKGIEIGVKKGIKVIKKHHPQKPSLITKRPHFSVTTPGKSNEGLEFAIGDTFCVLEADGK